MDTSYTCRDSLSMYGLFYHVNISLMRGHRVDVASGQDILVIICNMSLLKWTINENMAKKRLNFLYNPSKQIKKQLTNWLWIISFISGWVLSCVFSDEGTLSIYGHGCLDAGVSVDYCTVMQHYDFIFDFTQLGILFSYNFSSSGCILYLYKF